MRISLMRNSVREGLLTLALATAVTSFVSAPLHASQPCTAPESVKKLAALVEATFDDSIIKCEDSSSFSAKFKFECKGAKFFTTKNPNETTTLPNGDKVYVVTTLEEKNGRLAMTELVYSDYDAYSNGEQPIKVDPASFVSLSEKSFAFYSKENPSNDSWLMSVWYISAEETKAKGYKLFADKAVSCGAEK